MRLVAFLVTAAIAVTSVAAVPQPGLLDVDLVIFPTCGGGLIFDGYHSGNCACKKPGYESRNGQCKPKRKPKPNHGGRDQCYCARDRDNYWEYDRDDGDCDDDCIVFCCDPKDVKRKVNDYCPPHPKCDWPRKWSPGKKRCECPPNKIYKHGKCVWKPMRREGCKHPEVCFCSKSPKEITKYDEDHEYCQDDGYNTVFCCVDKPNKPREWCERQWKGKKGGH